MRFFALLLAIVLHAELSFAQSFFLNKGTITEKQATIDILRLNQSSIFDSSNAVISISENQANQLIISNSFQRNLTFQIYKTDDLILSELLKTGASKTIEIPSLTKGVYRYQLKNGIEAQSGVKGLLLVGVKVDFVWRIKELDMDYAKAFLDDKLSNTDYFPERFSINGFIYPQTMQDVKTKVNCKVGDTVDILIFNAGYMPHSMHVHGYHVLITESDSNPNQTGWSKDTFPVQKDRYCFIRLIPDKPGKYPVHDHYMGSVTVEGNYPGGMITMLDVSN
mgnify:CR=1 FL=1